MTKVEINPGVCGFKTVVKAEAGEDDTVKLQVVTGCKAVQEMMKTLGGEFDAFELCLVKPGCGPLYDYAGEHFPVHCACTVIAGIVKAAEVECHLALPRDADIRFLEGK